MGRCNIIPCCDLPKIEGSFNDLKDDIIDSFVNQNIISDWTLKDGVLEKYNNNEEFDNDDEREEEFWNEVVCRCLNKGYLVIYELPVPNGIHKIMKNRIFLLFMGLFPNSFYPHNRPCTTNISII